MDVGATLRQARTRKRLSLEQVAQSTKITISTLDALENNDFDRLPSGVYTRGFLRQFAREVDLDPEELVARYIELCDAAPPMADGEAEAASAGDDRAGAGDGPRHRTIVLSRLVPMPLLAVIVLVAAGAMYSGMWRSDGDPSVSTTAEAATTPELAPPPAPTPVSDVARAANAEPDTLRVELSATGPCWVSVTADGESALSRLLQAGDTHEIQAKDELVLRVGDPGTVAISVNGVAGRPLGNAGQPVTVQINRQNFREFQQS